MTPTSNGNRANSPNLTPGRAETVFDLLASRSLLQSPCLIEDGEKLSWKDIFDKSRAMASGLAELGVRSGDRVSIWLPNRSAWLVTFFACAQLDAIAVSINTRFRSVEVADLLGRSGSKVLVYWPGYKDIDFAGILEQCSPQALSVLENIICYTERDQVLPETVVGKPVTSFDDLLAKPLLLESYGRPESPCIIFTTSGTTKAPKLVVHIQRNVLGHAFNVARQYGLTSEDVFLLFPPFCGVYGFCSAMAALAAGCPLALTPTWDPVQYAQLMEAHAVTHLTASNEALAQLLDTRTGKDVFPSVKFMSSANINPAHNDIAERAERAGLKVTGVYGSSEMQALFSLGSLDTPAENRARPGGFPASSATSVRTRDPETKRLCHTDEVGELEFFAPESRFLEYFNDQTATASAFTDDGYFRSGDLGIVRSNGSFDFLARMGDVLRLGGFLVSPSEIEELIQQHPTIASCQIVGVNAQDAVRPIAFVIPRDGAQVVEQDIIKFAADRLAKFKVPIKVYAVDEFPTTPSANGSKVQKNKLREFAEQRLAQS